MVQCFVSGCTHKSGMHGCKLLCFPTGTNAKRKWIEFCRREDREYTSNDRVCSCHFKHGLKANGPTILRYSKWGIVHAMPPAHTSILYVQNHEDHTYSRPSISTSVEVQTEVCFNSMIDPPESRPVLGVVYKEEITEQDQTLFPVEDFDAGAGFEMTNRLHTDFVTSCSENQLEAHPEHATFACSQCSMQFKRSSILTAHLLKHAREQPFTCKQCSLLLTEENLRSHLRAHACKKQSECTRCDIEFSGSGYLDGHVCTHTSASPFACHLCSRVLASRPSLSQHLRAHARRKLYECSFCVMNFERSSLLKEHLHTHADAKPFTCPQCGLKLKSLLGLKVHLSSHRPKPFECTDCGEKYDSLDSLRKHMACQHFELEHRESPEAVAVDVETAHQSTPDLYVQNHEDHTYSSSSISTSVEVQTEVCFNSMIEPPESQPVLGVVYKEEIIEQDHTNEGVAIRTDVKMMDDLNTDEKPFACTQCGMLLTPLDTRAHLNAHTRKGRLASIYVPEKSFICTCCDKMFMNPENLKLHMRSHTDFKNGLEKPFETHTEQDHTLFPVEDFDAGSGSKMTNRLHTDFVTSCSENQLEAHPEHATFACSQCSMQFKRSSILTAHLLKHAREQPFTCKQCSLLLTEENLRSHLRAHACKKQSECTRCDIEFSGSGYLDGHVCTHTSASPFACHLCSRVLASRPSLSQHLRAHARRKLYECSFCEMNFERSSLLKEHLYTHADAKPFTCPQCGWKLKSFFGLKVHLSTHRPKPFACTDCGEKFEVFASLRKHMACQHFKQGESPEAVDVKTAQSSPEFHDFNAGSPSADHVVPVDYEEKFQNVTDFMPPLMNEDDYVTHIVSRMPTEQDHAILSGENVEIKVEPEDFFDTPIIVSVGSVSSAMFSNEEQATDVFTVYSGDQ